MYASWDKNKERDQQRNGRSGLNMLHQKLCEHMEEEIEVIMEYHRLSEQARDAGEEELAVWLYEIAKDEYSHAKYIHDHLKEIGYPIPNEEHIEAQFFKVRQL